MVKRVLCVIALISSLAFGQGIGGNAGIGGKAGIGGGVVLFAVQQQTCTGSVSVATATVVTGTGAGSNSCTTISAGQTIIAFACAGFGNLPNAMSDGGDTFTLIPVSAGSYCAVGYVMSSAGGHTNVTATLTNPDTSIIDVIVFSGLTAEDKSAVGSTGASPFTSGSTATTTAAQELLMGFIFGTAGTITPTGTNTFSGASTIFNSTCCSSNINMAIQTIVVGSTGAYAYTGTTGVSTDRAAIVTFK